MAGGAAAAIGAAGGIVDTVVGGWLTQNQTNKANAEWWQRWRAENQYNSPKAQMERLQRAGLNPNLVYGNGGATASSSSPAQPQTSQANVSAFGNAAQQIIAAQEQESRIRLNNANAAKIETETPVIPEQNRRDEEKNAREQADLELRKSMTQAEIDKKRKEMEEAESRINMNSKSMEKMRSEIKAIDDQNERMNKMAPLERRKTATDIMLQKLEIVKKEIENKNLPMEKKLQIQEAAKRILMLSKQITGAKLKNGIDAEILKLNKQGVDFSDSVFLRNLATAPTTMNNYLTK